MSSPPGGPANEPKEKNGDGRRPQDDRRRMRAVVHWKLETEVEDTRRQIIRRARYLAENLTRLAEGLQADPDSSFNTIGELQGNGLELDTWCAKLGFAREAMRMFHQAMQEPEQAS